MRAFFCRLHMLLVVAWLSAGLVSVDVYSVFYPFFLSFDGLILT